MNLAERHQGTAQSRICSWLLPVTMALGGIALATGPVGAAPGDDDDAPQKPSRIMWPRPPVEPKQTDRRTTKPPTSRRAPPPRVLWQGLEQKTTPTPTVAIAPEPPVTPSLVTMLLEPVPQSRGHPRASASSMFRAPRVGLPRSQTTALEPQPLPPAAVEEPNSVLVTDLARSPASQHALLAQASRVVLRLTPELTASRRLEPAPLFPLGIAISGAVFGSSVHATPRLPATSGPTLTAARTPWRFSPSLWAGAAEAMGSHQAQMSSARQTPGIQPRPTEPTEIAASTSTPSQTQTEPAEASTTQSTAQASARQVPQHPAEEPETTTPDEEPIAKSHRNPLAEPQDGGPAEVTEPALATRLEPAFDPLASADTELTAPALSAAQANSAHRISPALWQNAEGPGESSVLVAARRLTREVTPDPDRESRGAIRATAPVWGPARPVAGPAKPSALVARVEDPARESQPEIPAAGETDQPSGLGDEGTAAEPRAVQDPELSHSPPEVSEPSPQVTAQPMDPMGQAIRDLEQRVQREPDKAGLWFQLAQLYIRDDPPNWILADNALRTVVTLERDFSEAWFELGLLLLKQDQVIEAVDMLEKCVKHDPSHVNAYNALGNARLRLGQNDDAMRAYELAVQALETLVARHVDRSRQLRADGRHQDALHEATLALQLDPLNGPALLCHGLALVALDRHQLARRDLEQLWLNHPPLAKRLRQVLVD